MARDDPAPTRAAPRRRKTAIDAAAVEMAPAATTSAGAAPRASAPGTSGVLTVAEDGSAITADRVEVQMGSVGRVDATELTVSRGAVGAARTDQLSIERGALGAAVAGTADVKQSIVRSILARQVTIQQSFVRSLVAADVRIERSTLVGFMLARRVAGDVRVLVDWRGAAAFGALFGILAGVIGRRRRR